MKPINPKKPNLGLTVLADCEVLSFPFFAAIAFTNSAKRYRTYKVISMPEIIIGRSCTRNTYFDKSIGAINLESLKVIVYHEAATTSRAQITPKMIVRFVLFFIMLSSKEIYLSLDKTNISLLQRAVNSERYKYITFLPWLDIEKADIRK